MIDLAGADREGRDRGTLDDRERVALEQEAVRARRRVRAVAVDHDVAAGRVGGGGRPPLGARPGSPPRLARAGPTRRSWRSSRSRRALRMTRRRPSKAPARVAASRSVGSAAPARSSRIVGQARRGLEQVGHASRARRLPGVPGAGRGSVVPPCRDRASPVSADRGRSGRSPRTAGARPPPRPGRSPSGGLEAQVAVVGRGAVDHRVPGAGPLADPLERRDRQVAVGRLGRLEDLEHAAPDRGRTPRGSRRAAPRSTAANGR